MRYLHNCYSRIVQSFEKFHDLFALRGMQIACGFIGKNQRRITDYCTRYSYQLLLPTGQLTGVQILFPHYVKTIQRISNHPCSFAAFQIAIREWKIEILRNR